MTPAEILNKLDTCILALGQGNSRLKTLAIKKAQTEKGKTSTRDIKVKSRRLSSNDNTRFS